MVQVAWLGLGNMGRGMVRNLAKKGKLDEPLIIYNRTTSRAAALAEELKAHNVVVSTSIPDIINKSDVIFTIVGEDPAVKAMYDEIVKQDIKGKLIVDCSTVAPETTDGLSDLVTKAGAHFVASPVFGAPAAADAGQLVFVLASKDEAAIDRLLPYTKDVMGRAVIDLRGKPPSMAAIMKLQGNHMVLSMVLTLSESMVLASKSGLGEENVANFVEQMFGGPYVGYAKRMLSGDYEREDPLFAVDLALKDNRHIQNLAKKSGVPVKTMEEVERQLKKVKEEKGKNGDMAGMYGVKRMDSGLPYSNKKA